MPKVAQGEPLTNRIVTLVSDNLKDEYTAYCEAIGENVSVHIRTSWENELALYKASHVKK